MPVNAPYTGLAMSQLGRYRLTTLQETPRGRRFVLDPQGSFVTNYLASESGGEGGDGSLGPSPRDFSRFAYVGPPAQAAPAAPATAPAAAVAPAVTSIPPPPAVGDQPSREAAVRAEERQRKRKGPTSRFATSPRGLTGAGNTNRASLLPVPPRLLGSTFATGKQLLGA